MLVGCLFDREWQWQLTEKVIVIEQCARNKVKYLVMIIIGKYFPIGKLYGINAFSVGLSLSLSPRQFSTAVFLVG